MTKTWEELKMLSNGQWPDDECMKEEIAALRTENVALRELVQESLDDYVAHCEGGEADEWVIAARAALGETK